MEILTGKTDWKKMLKGKSERKINSAFHSYCLKNVYEYIPLKSLIGERLASLEIGRS